ncbi:3-alpha,7-alpha,12-alpha-trihydroxy-5-beta-cholest-24-enoyl-CoA hydratase [Sphingomonas sp. MG17]|uniref:3-alpha,7-alpha, 12-alpha-trihydroxy-5-beta-cholest-24-enoyl-CoA hydratase n=2 Tax=Sphingomonas tagetis TaxID=2949092 RepID=A0A9X2HR17_9SPHN|nr:3-alpha,7-alpha,12-alpha-trihydroxy-5-beta-cholest-24-enoyl-CoA hydratase [Sphingomonas tagetis]
MPIGSQLLDTHVRTVSSSWTARDCLIYALGVGAGMADPAQELEFTTENTEGKPLRVLPTFVLKAACDSGIDAALEHLHDVDHASMVHGEQSLTQHRELPASGAVETECRFVEVWDKGSGAAVKTRAWVRDARTGALYATCDQTLFFRGHGGWGGPRGPGRPQTATMTGEADVRFTIATRPDQALLYRLSGGLSPVHSDPAYARRAGFAGPILHGVCVLGSVGREFLRRYADGDPARFKFISARFAAPAFPGDDLDVTAWKDGRALAYEVRNQHGQPLLTEGRFEAD